MISNFGVCLNMCPEEEAKKRFQTRDRIHILERNNVSLNSIRFSDCIFVKEYSRSAAGTNLTSPSKLRPSLVLYKTIKYLLCEIFPLEKHSYYIIYSFIFDRSRAIRQDITIQQINDDVACKTLETIVLFLLYSSHVCWDYSLENFDPVINWMHVQECLISVLFLQEFNDINVINHGKYIAIYMLLNFGEETILQYALEKKNILKLCEEFTIALDMNIAYINSNYRKVIKLANKLDEIAMYSFHKNIFFVKLKYLQVLNNAFSFKQYKFPLNELCRLLNLTTDDAFNLIKTVNLDYINDDIIFNKKTLKYQKILIFDNSKYYLSRKEFLSKLNL